MCAQEPVRREDPRPDGSSPGKQQNPLSGAINEAGVSPVNAGAAATILEKETGLMTSLLKSPNQRRPQPGCNRIEALYKKKKNN